MTMNRQLNVAISDHTSYANVVIIPILRATKGLHFLGVVDGSNDARANFKSTPRTWSTVEDMLDDSEVDIVLVTRPLATRALFIRECLEAGKHVMARPPFARTYQETASLLEISERVGKLLCPLFHHRYDGDYNTIAKLLKYDKQLGELKSWEVSAFGFEQEMRGSDAAVELVSHMLDQVHHLLGMPKSVIGRKSISQDDLNVQDLDSITLGYENSVTVILNLGTPSVHGDDVKYHVQGSAGNYRKHHGDPQRDQLASGMSVASRQFGVEPNDHYGTLTLTSGGKGKVSKPYPTIKTPTWKGMYEDFALAVHGLRDIPNATEDAQNGQIIFEAALRSVQGGQEVIYL